MKVIQDTKILSYLGIPVHVCLLSFSFSIQGSQINRCLGGKKAKVILMRKGLELPKCGGYPYSYRYGLLSFL